MKYVLIAILAIAGFIAYQNYYQQDRVVNSVPQNIVVQEETDSYVINAAVPLTGFEKIDNVIRLENDVLLQSFKAEQAAASATGQFSTTTAVFSRSAQIFSSNRWGIDTIVVNTQVSTGQPSVQTYTYATDTGAQYGVTNFIDGGEESIATLSRVIQSTNADFEKDSRLLMPDTYQNFYVTDDALVFLLKNPQNNKTTEVVVPLANLQQHWRGWLINRLDSATSTQ